MLLPALAKAKAEAKVIDCVSNNKQIALAMFMYANDNGDQLPPLNSGGWIGYTTNWWFVILDKGRYLTRSSQTNENVWRCPEVKDADINAGVTAFYHQQIYGYGPLEDNLSGRKGGCPFRLRR